MKKLTRRILFLSALAILILTMAVSALANNAPVSINFAKADPDGNLVWNGTVSGDVNGALETVLLEARQSGPILHVVFDWIVTGDCSFTARLKGTLHTQTGKVIMNGKVIEGCLQGAQVHEQGQLIDPANAGFEGTIRIAPASAN